MPTQDLLYTTLRMQCITAHKGYGMNPPIHEITFHAEAGMGLNP